MGTKVETMRRFLESEMMSSSEAFDIGLRGSDEDCWTFLAALLSLIGERTGDAVPMVHRALRTAYAEGRELRNLAEKIISGAAPDGTPDFGAAQKLAVEKACAMFPGTFGLRGHEGDVFRISPRSSYVSRGRVVVYTERFFQGEWRDFAKGTIQELKRNLVR